MAIQSFFLRTPAGNAKSEWIDCVKGGGIILVAATHIVLYQTLSRDFIHIFHMPLFFFLSGLLFKPNPDGMAYFLKKARHLLVPYCTFLILLGLPSLVKMAMIGQGGPQALKLLAGGQGIGGTMAVLWFVTCLFATQQVMNFLLARWTTRLVSLLVAAGLLVSYVNLLYPDLWLPLNLHVVPAAMTYFFLGYLLRKTAIEGTLLLFAWTGSLAALVLVLLGVGVAQDLKNTVYGIPFVSVALALSLILAFMHLCVYLARTKIIGPLLATFGRYSMGIMFLHMPLAYAMRALPDHSETVRFIVAFSLSYAIARGMDRFALTRSLFLGAAPPAVPAVKPAVSAVI